MLPQLPWQTPKGPPRKRLLIGCLAATPLVIGRRGCQSRRDFRFGREDTPPTAAGVAIRTARAQQSPPRKQLIGCLAPAHWLARLSFIQSGTSGAAERRSPRCQGSGAPGSARPEALSCCTQGRQGPQEGALGSRERKAAGKVSWGRRRSSRVELNLTLNKDISIKKINGKRIWCQGLCTEKGILHCHRNWAAFWGTNTDTSLK